MVFRYIIQNLLYADTDLILAQNGAGMENGRGDSCAGDG